MYEPDVVIPRRYGVDQTVGDTLGPGGVFRGLRTDPGPPRHLPRHGRALPRRAAHQLLEPDGDELLGDGGRRRRSRRSASATASRAPPSASPASSASRTRRSSYWVAGHQPPGLVPPLRVERGARTPTRSSSRRWTTPEIYAKDPVRFEIMRHFDYFVTESSHHMSEYVPWFRKNPEMVDEVPADPLGLLRDLQESRGTALRQDPPPGGWRRRRSRSTARTSTARTSSTRSRRTRPAGSTGTSRNTGLITNLPADCCVEVPCLVDNTGDPALLRRRPPAAARRDQPDERQRPGASGDRPAVTGDRRYVYQAIQLDPLTGALLTLDQIRSMVDELFAAEADWLPQFK